MKYVIKKGDSLQFESKYQVGDIVKYRTTKNNHGTLGTDNVFKYDKIIKIIPKNGTWENIEFIYVLESNGRTINEEDIASLEKRN